MLILEILLMIFIFVFIFFQSILCITRFPRFEDLQLYRQGWPNQRIQVQCIQITQKGKKFYDSSNDVLNDFCWNSLPHSLTNSPYLWFLTSPPPLHSYAPPCYSLSFYFLFTFFSSIFLFILIPLFLLLQLLLIPRASFPLFPFLFLLVSILPPNCYSHHHLRVIIKTGKKEYKKLQCTHIQ